MRLFIFVHIFMRVDSSIHSCLAVLALQLSIISLALSSVIAKHLPVLLCTSLRLL